MAKEKRLKQLSEVEGAPDWYGKSLEELDFEWSREEKLEIERYCEKILKNVAGEEMTPKERFEATLAGRPRDRLLIHALPLQVYSVRALDSSADALKPVDVYRRPKLQVKAYLATVARFAMDSCLFYTTTYSEELWGAKVKMIEYGNPCIVGDTPINTVADLEGLDVPDPKKDGFIPGFLWACRELRRIYDEYGLTKILPLYISHCISPMTSMLIIVGMAKFVIALKKDPELCKRSTALATELGIKYGQAVQEVAQPDVRFLCIGPEAIPLKGNEWVVDFHAKLARALAPSGPVVFGPMMERILDWLPVFYEKGALGPGGFSGGNFVGEISYEKVIDFSREHDLYLSCGISDKVLLSGPASAIEEEVEVRCEYGKSHPKFSIGGNAVDYWTPQANLDAYVAACKKHGKL